MYRMYVMPISPKAPTFGAGAKIGNAATAEKDTIEISNLSVPDPWTYSNALHT